MEKKNLMVAIFIAIIAILVIVLLLAMDDIGPFGDAEPAKLPVDTIDSNLIVLWGQDGRQLKMEELAEDFKENGIPGGGRAPVVSIAFHRSDGTVFVADLDGKEILPCAGVVDGRIFPIRITEDKIEPRQDGDICENLKDTKIIGLSNSITITTHKSPDCPIESIGGYLIVPPECPDP